MFLIWSHFLYADYLLLCGGGWRQNLNYPFCFVVFGVDPDLTREGGSIPVTLTFQEATGKNVMLLPIGSCDDGAHSQNEKINRVNYINGVSKSPGMKSSSPANLFWCLLKTLTNIKCQERTGKHAALIQCTLFSVFIFIPSLVLFNKQNFQKDGEM